MPFTKEEALRAQEIAAVGAERVKTNWLIIDATTGRSLNADVLKEALQKISEKNDEEPDQVEILRATQTSAATLRHLMRTIPHFQSVLILCDGSRSFYRSLLPAILIARFFGKQAGLFYYPEDSLEYLFWLDYKLMSLFNRIFVGSRYFQRQLSKHQIESEVILPPIDLNSFPVRTIIEVQPHILIAHETANDAGAICAMRAFILVKQKYPRTVMTVITKEMIAWQMGIMQRGQNIQGHEYIKPDNENGIRIAFQQADVFVNCSSSESVPMALLGAMASGLPVICFESYGAREIFENGVNGILIRHHDQNQLADRILELIEQPQLVGKISQEAAKLRERLSPDKLARHLR